MKKVYFVVFEPIKYNWRLFPVQVLIQTRTWGKATHVGMFLDSKRLEDFIAVLKENLVIDHKENRYHDAGVIVSATWPKVKNQNVFDDYVNDRLFVKSIELTDYQYERLMFYWNQRRGKERYSISGLVWFLIGPVVNVVKNTRDNYDPKGEFCSEACVNALAYAGIQLFDFLCHPAEYLIYKARGEENPVFTTEEETLINTYFGYTNIDDFIKVAKFDNKWYWGYKVSPRLFKINPKLKPEVVFDITKQSIILVQ